MYAGLELAPESELDLGRPAARSVGIASTSTAVEVERSAVGLPSAASTVSARSAIAAFTIANQRLYPGESLLADSWGNPLSYEPAYFRERTLLRGFTPIDISQAQPVASQVPATRIIIPAIDVDSTVSELAILDLGGSRTYETPANTVGHIPATANAGEANSAWFFGHTESLTMGEGSVFFNLGKIPDKLRRGEDVHILTYNGEQQYLYRVTSS